MGKTQKQDNKQILDAVSLQFKSYNLFEEMMDLELQLKRISSIEEMKNSLIDETPDGTQVRFFSSEFLVKKYLKLSDQDLKLNDKLKNKELEEYAHYGEQSAQYSNDNDNLGHESLINKVANIISERLLNDDSLKLLIEGLVKDEQEKEKEKDKENKSTEDDDQDPKKKKKKKQKSEEE